MDDLEPFMDMVMNRATKRNISYAEAASELATLPHFDSSLLEQAAAALTDLASNVRSCNPVPAFDSGTRVSWYVPDQPKDRFWPRLEGILRDKGWKEDVVDSVDQSANRVVSLLHPPSLPAFGTRGLVLGYVQSGKTANFTAVMAKAADRKFQLFIVLAGIHNSLRRQTQERLEEELAHAGEWHKLTTADWDFVEPASSAATYFGERASQPVLCVIKKNAPRLARLKSWLEAGVKTQPGCLAHTPALIVDDEADQAGLNTGPDHDPSTINKLIVDILGLLPRHSYVAYTATPYANVLADPNAKNLYPEDFIVSLPRPSAYFGVERLFGSEPLSQDEESDELSMVHSIPMHEVDLVKPTGRNLAAFTPGVPPTLLAALRWFVLAAAVRQARGHSGKHTTMLIHSTVLADAHLLLAPKVGEALDEMEAASTNRREELRRLLKGRWDAETAAVPIGTLGEDTTTFDEAFACIGDVLQRIKVVVDNSRSKERLVFPKEGGSVQVVIGGNTLSRGLTLEGLTVSYFVRASSTYDTLMQMGRWFGYRGGYADLPRIWMTDELSSNFAHLARVEIEIREDIARYEQLGLTPKDLAVRVQTHSTLAVTSRLKMRQVVKAQATFSGAVKQTTAFKHRDADWLNTNTAAARQLLRACGGKDAGEQVWGKHWLWRDIDVEHIRAFLAQYQVHPNHQDMSAMAQVPPGEPERTLLQQYIELQVQEGQLRRWNVGVIGQTKAKKRWPGLLDGVDLPLLVRARLKNKDFADLGAILSQEDRALDLLSEPPAKGGKEFITRMKALRGSDESPCDPDRGVNTPLLLLYPIDPVSDPPRKNSNRLSLKAASDVVGLALLFPASSVGAVDYICAPIEETIETVEDMEV
jgi:hypothetical protein